MRSRKNVISKTKLFFRHGWPERWAFLEACFWIVVYEFARRLRSDGAIRRLFGAPGRKAEEDLDDAQIASAKKVGWAVEAARRHLPWRPLCLPRALAAKRMLRRLGIPCTLSLGVHSPEDGEFDLHVWLRCGDRILTGREVSQRFHLLETFV